MEKKRILAALVCLCMMMALLPNAALAAGAPVVIGGVELTETNCYYINGANGAPGSVTDTDIGNWNAHYYIDAANGNAPTLELKGLALAAASNTAYNGIHADGDLTIHLTSDGNTVGSSASGNQPVIGYGIHIGGRLTVTADNDAYRLTAISTRTNAILAGQTTISGGIVTGETNAADTNGIYANNITLSGNAQLIGISPCAGIYTAGDLTASDHAVVRGTGGTNSGVFSSGSITLSGFAAVNGSSENVGVNINGASGSITLNDSASLTGHSTGNGAYSYGMFLQNNSRLVLNGGTLDASGQRGAVLYTQLPSVFTLNYPSPGYTAAYDNMDAAGGSATRTSSYTYELTAKYIRIEPLIVNVAFNDLSANGSDSASTTELTLTFDKDIDGLAEEHITVTGAEKGRLTKNGTGIYTLTISNITVADGGTVNVAIAKTGFTFTPENKNVAVRRYTPPTPDPIQYPITEGQNGEWTQGSTGGLRFTANADYGKFMSVSVDGSTISSDKYTEKRGSTIVTLKASYLSTLSVGRHTLRVNFTDGFAETYFIVNGYIDIPKTGDSATPALWLGIALMAGAGLAASITIRRKRQNG